MKKSIAILLILSFLGCQKTEIEKVSPKPFDIENVKEWYLSKSSNAKINGNEAPKKIVKWEQAKKGTHFDGSDVWVIPINYEDKDIRMNLLAKNKEEPNKVKFKGKDELKNDNALEFLTIKKKENDSYEIENVVISEFKDKKKKEEFEGILYILDDNNKFKSGFQIEDNKVKYIFSEAKKAKINQLICSYTALTTTYTYTVTVGGSTSAPVPNGTQTTYTLIGCYYDALTSIPYTSYSGLVSNSSSNSSVPGYEANFAAVTGRICGNYNFTQVGNGFTGEVTHLFINAQFSSPFKHLSSTWGALCIAYGSNMSNSASASTNFVRSWNDAVRQLDFWMRTNVAAAQALDNQTFGAKFFAYFKYYMDQNSNGYFNVTTGGCLGNVSSTQATYCVGN